MQDFARTFFTSGFSVVYILRYGEDSHFAAFPSNCAFVVQKAFINILSVQTSNSSFGTQGIKEMTPEATGGVQMPASDQTSRPGSANPYVTSLESQVAKIVPEQEPEQDPKMIINLLDSQFERLVDLRIQILRAFHDKVPSSMSQQNLNEVCSGIGELQAMLLQVNTNFDEFRRCKQKSN